MDQGSLYGLFNVFGVHTCEIEAEWVLSSRLRSRPVYGDDE